MSGRGSQRRLVVVLAAASLLVSGACSGGTGEDSASAVGGTATSSTAAPAGGRTVSWDVALTSAQRIIRQVGPASTLNYGWNELVGPTTVDGAPAQVQMLGNVDYENGTGPFFGFVTLEFATGDVLALRMDGQATQSPGAQGSTDSSFQAELTVIGGSGAYVGATGGRGTFTGSRSAELGGQVTGSMTVTVAGL